DERAIWGWSILALLAGGLNPAFFGIIPGMIAYRQSFMQNTLREWHAPSLGVLSWYLVLLAGSIVALVWARRRARPADWLMFLVFAALSLMAMRNVIFLGLVAPLIIFSYLPPLQRFAKPTAEYAVAALLAVGCAAA